MHTIFCQRVCCWNCYTLCSVVTLTRLVAGKFFMLKCLDQIISNIISTDDGDFFKEFSLSNMFFSAC